MAAPVPATPATPVPTPFVYIDAGVKAEPRRELHFVGSVEIALVTRAYSLRRRRLGHENDYQGVIN
jgi:hypothetical protein